jgi:hypothetical protein
MLYHGYISDMNGSRSQICLVTSSIPITRVEETPPDGESRLQQVYAESTPVCRRRRAARVTRGHLQFVKRRTRSNAVPSRPCCSRLEIRDSCLARRDGLRVVVARLVPKGVHRRRGRITRRDAPNRQPPPRSWPALAHRTVRTDPVILRERDA